MLTYVFLNDFTLLAVIALWNLLEKKQNYMQHMYMQTLHIYIYIAKQAMGCGVYISDSLLTAWLLITPLIGWMKEAAGGAAA